MKNFPDVVKEIDIEVQEAQGVQIQLDRKRTTSRHIIIKMLKVKDKERLLQEKRQKLPTKEFP